MGLQRMLEKAKQGLGNGKDRRLRLFFSLAVLMSMSALTALAWDGIGKRLAICAGLAVLSSILPLLPEPPNWIALPFLALYLYFVPMKIFQRMELPVQDMSAIKGSAAELTAAFVICGYLLAFLLTQSTAIALGAGSGFFLLLFLAEYYLWKFRGDFLMPSDLRAAGTAMTVARNYDYRLSPEALYTVVYFLFFIILGSRIRVGMNRLAHLAVSLLAVLSIFGWYRTVMDLPDSLKKELVVDYWNVANTRNLNGACLSYFLLAKDSREEVPDGYSEKAIREIADAAEAAYVPSGGAETPPDIIMIMNEAWSDLRVLGELETTEAFMPFADSFTGNTVRGNLYVNILGGITANTEFEALTGNSLSLLAPGVVPYQNQVRHDMPSLARILKNQGYETMSMHPSGEGTWSRKKVYAYFGFDTFIHQGLWEVPHGYVRTFISDECNYQEIIHRYENRNRDVPFFLFDVTIQNHGDYWEEDPAEIGAVSVGGIPAEEVGSLRDLATYLSLMKLSDGALEQLAAYFRQVQTPVILCIFGDHQPLLEEGFYQAVFAGGNLSEREQNLRKYIVPYLIWANYDVDWKEYGDMSANYLPAALMECAGLKLPPFYQYLMELHGEYPVLTKRGCLDREGNLVDIADIWDTDLIENYRMLQHNQLYTENYRADIFEEAAR